MRTGSQFRYIVFPRWTCKHGVLDLARPAERAGAGVEARRDLPREAAAFVEWLFGQVNLDARAYRAETLQRRLSACLRFLRVTSPEHARRLLENKPALTASAISSMLVGVTSFFRDSAVFEALRQQVLQPFCNRSGQRMGLYAWSIGCSDGAELYSLALLMAEMDILSGSYLLGTDCRRDAIEKAKAGCYDAARLREVPMEMRTRWFSRQDSVWQVAPLLRQSSRWRVANIIEVREPGLWDVILFRNTSMYLRSDRMAGLWQQLENSLRPGGVLVLGKAERPLGSKRLSMVAPCIYRRVRR
ncbi:MAG: CheR family methyltransferase [Pirellulales bacterium]